MLVRPLLISLLIQKFQVDFTKGTIRVCHHAVMGFYSRYLPYVLENSHTATPTGVELGHPSCGLNTSAGLCTQNNHSSKPLQRLEWSKALHKAEIMIYT